MNCVNRFDWDESLEPVIEEPELCLNCGEVSVINGECPHCEFEEILEEYGA